MWLIIFQTKKSKTKERENIFIFTSGREIFLRQGLHRTKKSEEECLQISKKEKMSIGKMAKNRERINLFLPEMEEMQVKEFIYHLISIILTKINV